MKKVFVEVASVKESSLWYKTVLWFWIQTEPKIQCNIFCDVFKPVLLKIGKILVNSGSGTSKVKCMNMIYISA